MAEDSSLPPRERWERASHSSFPKPSTTLPAPPTPFCRGNSSLGKAQQFAPPFIGPSRDNNQPLLSLQGQLGGPLPSLGASAWGVCFCSITSCLAMHRCPNSFQKDGSFLSTLGWNTFSFLPAQSAPFFSQCYTEHYCGHLHI